MNPANTLDNKKRQPWLDVIRGICALLVIFFHIPSSPLYFTIFYDSFMIPAFFFVSGYLSKKYNENIGQFLYNRILKLFIFRGIAAFEARFFTITMLCKCLKNPKFFAEQLIEVLCNWITGQTEWFISCIILVMIYFTIINTICKDRLPLMLALSAVLAGIGLYVSTPQQITHWSWDTAMVCQLFYVIGYCIKKKQWIEKWRLNNIACVLFCLAHIALVTVFAIIFGAENIWIIVANNTWACIPVTTLLILSGNTAVICLSQKLQSSSKLLSYIGQHTLLFYSLGGICMIDCYTVLDYIRQITGFGFLYNPYIFCPLILLMCTSLTLIICIFSDKFCPALNGKINLPELKLKKSEAV